MGWNTEIAAVRTGQLTDAVPDVFAATSTTMGFEEATSAARAPHLCAAQVGDWAVVIDAACRLSGNTGYLTTVSAAADLHLVRLADDPIALHYRGGRQLAEARGRAACLALAPRGDQDGELCAADILASHTGVDVREDLWGLKFTVFEPDL